MIAARGARSPGTAAARRPSPRGPPRACRPHRPGGGGARPAWPPATRRASTRPPRDRHRSRPGRPVTARGGGGCRRGRSGRTRRRCWSGSRLHVGRRVGHVGPVDDQAGAHDAGLVVDGGPDALRERGAGLLEPATILRRELVVLPDLARQRHREVERGPDVERGRQAGTRAEVADHRPAGRGGAGGWRERGEGLMLCPVDLTCVRRSSNSAIAPIVKPACSEAMPRAAWRSRRSERGARAGSAYNRRRPTVRPRGPAAHARSRRRVQR